MSNHDEPEDVLSLADLASVRAQSWPERARKLVTMFLAGRNENTLSAYRDDLTDFAAHRGEHLSRRQGSRR